MIKKNEINFETIPISSTNKQRKHELQNMSLIFFTHLIPISVSFQPSYVYNNHPDKCEKKHYYMNFLYFNGRYICSSDDLSCVHTL